MDSLPNVLFVCTFSGGRSQIAEAYARKYAADVFNASSACFDPGKISPGFVAKVARLGLDIQEKSPVSVFTLFKDQAEYDYVVCLCRNVGSEMCSLFRSNIDRIFPNSIERPHWDVIDFGECQKDPKGFDACFEETCQLIEKEVIALKETIIETIKK